MNFVLGPPVGIPAGFVGIHSEIERQSMNKSRQLLADVMLVVVLCVAAVMVELEAKGGVDRLRQFVVPTILLGVVLIVGLIIIASKHSEDTSTMG